MLESVQPLYTLIFKSNWSLLLVHAVQIFASFATFVLCLNHLIVDCLYESLKRRWLVLAMHLYHNRNKGSISELH